VTLDVPYAEKGGFMVEIRSNEQSTMSRGDTGTVLSVLNAYVTSIRVG
jgi:hypothetical protein